MFWPHRRVDRIEALHELEASVYGGLDRAREIKDEASASKLEEVRDWIDTHRGSAKELLSAKRAAVDRILAELR